MTFPTFAVNETLRAADMNAVGLWLVKTQTISVAASTQDITSCFSANYSNYRVVIENLTTSAIIGLQMQFLVGTTPTATGYYWSAAEITHTTPALTATGDANSTAGTVQIIGFTTPSGASIEIYSPQKAIRTSYTSNGVDMRTTGGSPFRYATGFQDSNTQFDGFRLLTGGATTITGGIVRVYGYRN